MVACTGHCGHACPHRPTHGQSRARCVLYSPLTLVYQPPRASMTVVMPNDRTIVADLTFTGAAVEVQAQAFNLQLPGGLSVSQQTLTSVGTMEGSRARQWRLVAALEGGVASDSPGSMEFSGDGCYPPSILPITALDIQFQRRRPAALQASSLGGFVLLDGSTTGRDTFVFTVSFEEPSTFSASDLEIDVDGDATLFVGDVTVEGSMYGDPPSRAPSHR